ncbi:MAG: hypothetical protein EYC69_02110 [Bacteroidetes bacterium]|nr:MAG: hypothetical protein EYC69_02110 [Bacteroidota bacterium]
MMGKKNISSILFLLLLVFQVATLYAQDNYNLSEINAAAKTQFVKPETLDRLMIRLRMLENNLPADQDDLLIETYKTIAEQYIANNHYSQAYAVYSKCMTFKQESLARKFINSIDSTKKNIEERRTNDGTELMNLQNQVQELQIDNDLLVSKRINFKKYFSFIIIALSTLFALILVRSALKLINIRSQLKENKESMKLQHRIATLGFYVKGLVNQTRHKAGQMEDMAASIQAGLQKISSSELKNTSFASDVKLHCKEIKKELNASGIDA